MYLRRSVKLFSFIFFLPIDSFTKGVYCIRIMTNKFCYITGKELSQERIEALEFLGVPESEWTHESVATARVRMPASGSAFEAEPETEKTVADVLERE